MPLMIIHFPTVRPKPHEILHICVAQRAPLKEFAPVQLRMLKA
jgi:hypothetical protein